MGDALGRVGRPRRDARQAASCPRGRFAGARLQRAGRFQGGSAIGPGAERSPLVVVGWSLGGQIALKWALAHPERIARLVLVATTPRFAAGDGWEPAMSAQTLQRFGDELEVAWKATVLRFLTLQMRGSEHGHAALASLRNDLYARGEPSRRTLSEALAALSASDLRGAVPRIAHPALVVAGERDTLAPAAAGTMPNADFVSVVGAAHVPFLSHPDAFGRALAEFLDAR